MSDTYLNKAGLAYFWSKLKAWASGLFVHRTGAETVHDLKSFAFDRSSNPANGIAVQSLDIDKGVAPSADCFCSLGFFDKDFSAETASSEADVIASRLAVIDYAARSTGRVDFQFYVQDPDSALNDGLRFRIGYEADRTPFFVGPSTKDNPYSGEIITYDWLPKDTRLVHTTGDETVGGSKTFANNWTAFSGTDPNVALDNTVAVRTAAPSSLLRWRVMPRDKNGDAFGTLCWSQRTSGSSDVRLDVCNANAELAYFYLGWDANGVAYATAPSTSASRSTATDIVTRDWIPRDTRVVHTTGDETVGGIKTFDSDIRELWSILLGRDTAKGSTTQSYRGLYFCSSGGYSATDRLAKVESHIDSNGYSKIYLSAYKNEANTNTDIKITVGWDANGGYAAAPSTRSNRTEGTDIVTRDWLASDSRLVHTTGNEDIGGYKTFSNSPTVYLWEGDNTIQAMRVNAAKGTNPTSTGKYATVAAFEKSGNLYVANRIAALNLFVDTGGNTYASLTAYKYVSGTTNVSDFSCICAPDGTSYQRSTSIRPLTTNAYSLGTGNYKYTAVYATNGSIQTSDERFKHDIDFIPDAVLDVWESVEWKQFRMLDSVQKKGRASARVHAGAIAQQIQKAFADAGLDVSAYGFFCHDEWEQTQELRDGDGQVVVPYNPAGDSYALRYDEALCIEAAYLRRENARLKARIASLEERLAALEMKLS